jgi:Ca-activated chloride channel family protein
MIHFACPWMLLLLPLPWIFARLLPSVEPQGAALFLPFAASIGHENTGFSFSRPRWHSLLLIIIWLLLIFAATRPQWLGDPQPIPTTGRELMLAVDVSGSMATPDMANNTSRLQVVQQVAGNFIQHRYGDQVGLILFGTQPYLQAPLTLDLGTVQTFLQEAMIGVAGPETAIGDAIGLAIKRLKDDVNSVAKPSNMVMILLTDGGNNAGMMPPLEAAKLAAKNGLRIYTIGVGAAVQQGVFGSSGNTDLDESTLQSIAKITGGAYFRATDSSALQQVYAQINKLEPAAGHAQWYRPSTEWFFWPLGLALLFSIPTVLLMRGRM